MDDILATATTLDRVLLETDEEDYDNTALQLLIALRKTSLTDQDTLLKARTSASPARLQLTDCHPGPGQNRSCYLNDTIRLHPTISDKTDTVIE